MVKADMFNLATSTQPASAVASSYGVTRRLGKPPFPFFNFGFLIADC